MSLILAKQLSRSSFRVFCEGCGQPTDVVDSEELSGMVAHDYHVFCPCCEGATDEYHEIFTWYGEPFFVTIDGSLFCIDWPSSIRECNDIWRSRIQYLRDFIKDVKPMDASSLACLVSTYLHSFPEEGSSNA